MCGEWVGTSARTRRPGVSVQSSLWSVGGSHRCFFSSLSTCGSLRTLGSGESMTFFSQGTELPLPFSQLWKVLLYSSLFVFLHTSGPTQHNLLTGATFSKQNRELRCPSHAGQAHSTFQPVTQPRARAYEGQTAFSKKKKQGGKYKRTHRKGKTRENADLHPQNELSDCASLGKLFRLAVPWFSHL